MGRRVLYGFLARAGWRSEEALGGKVEQVENAAKDEGQRLVEVPALTWRRVDLRHGVVHLDREKTGRPRPVPLDPDIVRALGAWRTVLTPKADDDDLVFVDMTGAPIDRHGPRSSFASTGWPRVSSARSFTTRPRRCAAPATRRARWSATVAWRTRCAGSAIETCAL